MDLWEYTNGVVSLLCAIALSWVTLHPQIDEGLITKIGLVTMILSLAGIAAVSFTAPWDYASIWRAGFSMRAGLLIACIGVLIRAQVAAGRWRIFSGRRRRA